MRRFLVPVVLVAASVVALGCETKVIDGTCEDGDANCTDDGNTTGANPTTGGAGGAGATGGSSAGGSSTGGSSTGGAGGVGGVPNVDGIALLQWQVNGDPGGGSVTVGGPTESPYSLHVIFRDLSVLCSDPNAALPCGEHYEVTLVIPVEEQYVGPVSLATPGVSMSFSETGPDEGGGECSFGGGGAGSDGEFTIVSIDETHITVDLTGTIAADFTGVAGPLTALRCP